MPPRSTLELSRLRDIGWSKWDPIGLGGPENGWLADEYDTYLLQAAGHLWNGQSDDEVADYLVRIETKQMGLQAIPGIRQRALDVAKAIRLYVEAMRR